MARVTATEVKDIIDTSLSDTQVGAYIDSVTVMVDNLFSGVTITTELIKEIERWLTAHAIATTRERQAKEEGAGGAYIKYAGYMSGEGLKSTSYGQMALSMDTTNTLISTMGKKVIFYGFKEDYS